jgi:subtilisin family serine protease
VLNAAVIEIPEVALSGILRNPRVLSVELDAEVLVDPTRVTQTGATWGLDRVDQRNLPLSGSFSSSGSGQGVSVYVVDTGIDAGHSEFSGRVLSGFDAIGGTDGRTDCNGHGTHVAGTIASTSFGVAKTANLVPVKVLACDGSGSYSGVIAGLDWIVKTRSIGQKAVVNMSLGGGASSSLDAAVSSVIASGIAVVVAAGNSNTDACTASPARVAAAITVGATTESDSRSSFSNYGKCLDMFAPGSNIKSTIPGNASAVYSGTSMASPHVAGIAAVAIGRTAMTPTELSVYLRETATAGVLSSVATDSPNLLAFLDTSGVIQPPSEDTSATVPAQPNAPVAAARSKSVAVSWTLPDNGGAQLISQTIRVYVGGLVSNSIRVDGVTSSVRISKLRTGTQYQFSVQATNSVGVGAISGLSNSVTPLR